MVSVELIKSRFSLLPKTEGFELAEDWQEIDTDFFVIQHSSMYIDTKGFDASNPQFLRVYVSKTDFSRVVFYEIGQFGHGIYDLLIDRFQFLSNRLGFGYDMETHFICEDSDLPYLTEFSESDVVQQIRKRSQNNMLE